MPASIYISIKLVVCLSARAIQLNCKYGSDGSPPSEGKRLEDQSQNHPFTQINCVAFLPFKLHVVEHRLCTGPAGVGGVGGLRCRLLTYDIVCSLQEVAESLPSFPSLRTSSIACLWCLHHPQISRMLPSSGLIRSHSVGHWHGGG
jgi:hypothetical protein